MQSLRAFPRRGYAWLLTAGCWLAPAGRAWAQAGDGGARGASPWVMSYALVFLGIGLGLLILCKPSKRREKAKVEQ